MKNILKKWTRDSHGPGHKGSFPAQSADDKMKTNIRIGWAGQ